MKEKVLELFDCRDMRLLPECIMKVLFSEKRDEVYKNLLELFNYDVSYEWFASLYESELSERKEKKQDFTPNTVSLLCSALVGSIDGGTYEPTAGNGSMIIADWWRKASLHIPFDFYPSLNPVECWELSDRSLPILLLNLSIRGIVGIVHHGDVLEQKEFATYRLTNEEDDCLGFSKIIRL